MGIKARRSLYLLTEKYYVLHDRTKLKDVVAFCCGGMPFAKKAGYSFIAPEAGYQFFTEEAAHHFDFLMGYQNSNANHDWRVWETPEQREERFEEIPF